MVDSYGLHIGPLYLHFYALIIVLAMFAAAWLTVLRAKAQGFNPEFVWNGLVWAIVPGVIGARLYHVLTPTPASGLTTQYYLQNPLQMLAIWNGGLGIYGGIVGGAIGVYVYVRRQNEPFLKWLDLAVVGVVLAQAIGRWGNFVNQELYGAPTTLPWAIYIPPNKRLPGFEQYNTFHPLFLYESLWNMISFGVLLFIERRYRNRLRAGDLVLVYLILYPIGRFLLDYVRLDSNGFGILTTAQLVSAFVIIIAGLILFKRHRNMQPPTSKSIDESSQIETNYQLETFSGEAHDNTAPTSSKAAKG